MAKKEANFDLYIHDLLVEAGIHADTQGSNIIEINNALKSASKRWEITNHFISSTVIPATSTPSTRRISNPWKS